MQGGRDRRFAPRRSSRRLRLKRRALDSTMRDSEIGLAAWIVCAAILGGILVPGTASIVAKLLVVPLAIAGPVGTAIIQRKIGVAAAFTFPVVGILLHGIVSALVYRYSAGYNAFHDGLTIPIGLISVALQLAVVAITLALCAVRRFIYRGAV